MSDLLFMVKIIILNPVVKPQGLQQLCPLLFEATFCAFFLSLVRKASFWRCWGWVETKTIRILGGNAWSHTLCEHRMSISATMLRFRARKAFFRSNLRWMDGLAEVTENGNKRGRKRNKTHPVQAHNKGRSPIDIYYQQSTIKALKDDMKDKNDGDCHHSLPLIIMHHQSSREMTQHWRQLWCKQINTRTSPSQMTQPNDPTIKHAAKSLVDVDDDRHLSSTYTVMHQTLNQDDNATRTIMMQTNQHKNRSKPNDSTIKQTFEGLVLLYQWRGSSMKEKQQ